MADRYETAADLAEDLRHWLAPDAARVAGGPARGARRGRSAGRAQGACGRSTRTTPTSSSRCCPARGTATACPSRSGSGRRGSRTGRGRPTFAVGLLYGPSGCGKSSLVKAGLLPRLGPSRPPGLRRGDAASGPRPGCSPPCGGTAPDSRPEAGLAEALAAAPRGRAGRPAGKVLIVLDQFEQWLHAHPDEPDAELVARPAAVRRRRLQALLLVRDDFWMAVTRFFQALEVRLVEGQNSAAVELFDARTPARVLARVRPGLRPAARRPGGARPEAAGFLDQAVARAGGPGRPDHPGPAEPVRRDGPATPLDARRRSASWAASRGSA